MSLAFRARLYNGNTNSVITRDSKSAELCCLLVELMVVLMAVNFLAIPNPRCCEVCKALQRSQFSILIKGVTRESYCFGKSQKGCTQVIHRLSKVPQVCKGMTCCTLLCNLETQYKPMGCFERRWMSFQKSSPYQNDKGKTNIYWNRHGRCTTIN